MTLHIQTEAELVDVLLCGINRLPGLYKTTISLWEKVNTCLEYNLIQLMDNSNCVLNQNHGLFTIPQTMSTGFPGSSKRPKPLKGGGRLGRLAD